MDEQQCFYNKNVGILIRRNLSCSAGNLFEKLFIPGYREEYLLLVEKLISKNGIGDYTFAFHFISNTISGDSDNESLVSSDFIPILKKIWEDPRLE